MTVGAAVKFVGSALTEGFVDFFEQAGIELRGERARARGKRSSHFDQSFTRELLVLLQNITHFNHANLAEFTFLSGEKHKALKSALWRGGTSAKSLEELLSELMNYLNREFLHSSLQNFEYLHSYFELRSSERPRICLKGNRVDGEEQIISIFRDDPVNYVSDIQVKGNTGFEFIRQNGTYFIENDIPKAVVRGRYRNPRLATERIRADRQFGVDYISENWESYWDVGARRVGDGRSHYKSTLILPLTFRNNSLSSSFKTNFKAHDVGKLIFGYLCLDHPKSHFFDEDLDVPVCAILADWLADYMFVRFMYVDISETFHSVQSILKGASRELVIGRLADVVLQEKMHHLAQKAMSFGLQRTHKNQLVGADQILLTFVDPSDEKKRA